MTNKTKPRKGRKGLKLLDLSFDCESQPDPKCTRSPGVRVKSAWTRSAPIGYKSHGSQRAMKLHPPSPYSFNKSTEYQNQIQADLEQLITAESLMHVSSPTWAIAVSHESNHSGESPLFVHRLLSPGKYDTKPTYRSTASNKFGRQRPLSANDAGRYHPNSTHQYLTKTGLNVSQSEIDLRLGKPTRTTLLRARQRVNSAPQNAYDIHREYVKRVDKLAESRRTLMPSYSLQDLLEIPLEDESLHSFLTGARYNRAHYLDAKSLITHGVYMPRSNPAGCFIMPRNKYSEQTAEAPSDSPHDYDHGSAYRSQMESNTRSASSPLPPPQRPSSPQPTTSPDEENRVEPSESLANQAEGGGVREDEPAESGRLNVNGESIVSKETKERKNCLAAMRSVMSADDALSIKGKGLDNMRPGYHHVSGASMSTTHNETPPAILAVSVSGMSLTRSLTFASGADRSVLVGQPLITPVPRVSSTKGQRQEERKVKSAPAIAEKTPVQMEDKCFNVPSISSDDNEDFEHGVNGKMEEASGSLGRERKSHVRFADQVDVASSGQVAECEDQVGMSSEGIDRSEVDQNDPKDQLSSSADDAAVFADDSAICPEQLDSSKNQVGVSADQFATSEAQMSMPSEPVGIMPQSKETPTVGDHGVSDGNKEGKADDNVVFFMTEEEAAVASKLAKNASTQHQQDESQNDAMQSESHPEANESHEAHEQSRGHGTDEVECQEREVQGQSTELKPDDLDSQGNNLGSLQTLNTSDILSQDEGDVMPNGVISVEISKCERAETTGGGSEPIIAADLGSDVTDLLASQSTEREEGTLPTGEVESEELAEPIICVDISTKPAREQQD